MLLEGEDYGAARHSRQRFRIALTPGQRLAVGAVDKRYFAPVMPLKSPLSSYTSSAGN